MWRNNNDSYEFIGCLIVMLIGVMVPVALAQTPLDGGVNSILAALRGPWGNLIITGGAITLAVGVLVAIQHPAALIYVGIGFVVLFLVGAAISGRVYEWVVG